MKNTVVPAAQKVEFETLKIGAPEKLFVGVFGRSGTGKTRLMATAPGLGVVPLQRKVQAHHRTGLARSLSHPQGLLAQRPGAVLQI